MGPAAWSAVLRSGDRMESGGTPTLAGKTTVRSRGGNAPRRAAAPASCLHGRSTPHGSVNRPAAGSPGRNPRASCSTVASPLRVLARVERAPRGSAERERDDSPGVVTRRTRASMGCERATPAATCAQRPYDPERLDNRSSGCSRRASRIRWSRVPRGTGTAAARRFHRVPVPAARAPRVRRARGRAS